MHTILVVDDDQYIRDLVSIHLKEEGYEVITAINGEDALLKLESTHCHLAIVDIMMPKMDGNELTKIIRDFYNIPIILLTAKDQITDKEKGFLSGADDYMVKPFEPKELLFRMRNLFRLYNIAMEETIELGHVKIDKKSYEVTIDGKAYLLPLKEFELLFLLASHKGQVFSRMQIIDQVWGYDYDGDERTVDVHIKRLRERFKHITDDFTIKTMRGVGYTLEEGK
ncbi:MAG TPA: response regulator transcription factor [Pseudogracilibacillus sp.]|nr:response regulator transcription factor [Pseudogracilibacillus sp.]